MSHSASPNPAPNPLVPLVAVEAEPCVSIYLPIEHRAADPTRNHTRLENLLRRAAEALRERSPGVDAVAMLAPARALLQQKLWRDETRGLALFATRDFFHRQALPFAVEERVEVGGRLWLRPLLPLLVDGRHAVLALSLAGARLVSSTPDGVVRLELGDDTSFEAVMGYAVYDTHLQLHSTGAPRHGSRGPAMFHGHGATDADRFEEDLRHYFRRLAERVEARLDPKLPLVLATVEEYVPLYRDANRHPALLAESLPGNPEQIADETLAERARPIVAGWHRRRALDRYVELGRRGHSSDRLEYILRAAVDGRVDTLLVAEGVEEWGQFDPLLRETDVHVRRMPGDEDLVHRAAVETLRHGGTVQPLPIEIVPGGVSAVAALRY